MVAFTSALLTRDPSARGTKIPAEHWRSSQSWCLSVAKVKSTVRQMCEEQKAVMLRRGLLPDPDAPPAAKRKRTRARAASDDDDRYARILGGETQPEHFDEVEKYLLIRTAGSNVKSRDLLKWWKERSADLPILSRVVRMVLATPASSSASERNFSVAGRLITPRRNCLAPDTVDILLFLFNFLNKKRQRRQQQEERA
ncbi:hypothetical protein FOCC_FOCC008347 [Frankliniella occidentalis]|nr:hypothetical protein FOCC_FOCC008347 [Frankliniella occidentalis]